MSRERAKEASVNLKFSPIFWLFMACLGYFMYGGIQGAMAIFVMTVAFSFSLLFSIIPFFGIPIWLYVMGQATPMIFALTGISASLLTGGIFWVTGALVIIINLFIDLALLSTRW